MLSKIDLILALYSYSVQTEDLRIFFPILKLSLWEEWIRYRDIALF